MKQTDFIDASAVTRASLSEGVILAEKIIGFAKRGKCGRSWFVSVGPGDLFSRDA